MEIFLVLLYSLILSAILKFIPGFSKFRLSRNAIISLFLLKVAAGLTYTLIYRHYYNAGDFFRYFSDSKVILGTLWDNPAHFFELLFGYDPSGRMPEYLSYVNDKLWFSWRTPEYTMVRLMVIFNLLSFQHLYVNVVLISFLSTVALLLLYELLIEEFPEKRIGLLVTVFLIPSALLWCSGFHKDSFTLSFIIFCLYAVKRMRLDENYAYSLLFVFSFFILYWVRDYILILLLPNIIALALTLKRKEHILLKFIFINVCFYTLLWGIQFLNPALNVLERLVFEQDFFLNMKGKSTIYIARLEPSVWSIIKSIPRSLYNVLLRPFPFEAKDLVQGFAAVETFLLFLFMIYCGIKNRIGSFKITGLLAFCLIFSISYLIMIGLLVPAIGTIARYKSIVLPFLLSFWVIIAANNQIADKFALKIFK